MPQDPQRDNPMDGLRSMVLRGPTPFSNTIIFLNIVLLIVPHAFQALQPIVNSLIVDSSVLTHPWALALYSLVPLDPINLLFAGSAFWLFGGSLERSWGTGRYALLYVVFCVISGLSVLLGGYLLHIPAGIATLLMPLAGILIAFCALNPGQSISFWFVPIPTKWVMAIVFGMVWYFMGHALLGLFAEIAPALALWYVYHGRSWGDVGHYTQRKPARGDIIDFQAARKRKSNAVYLDGSIKRSPLDFAGRWKDMQERRRLARLLKNSGLIDPEDRR